MTRQSGEGEEREKRQKETAKRREMRAPERERDIMHQDGDIDPADFFDPEEFSAKRSDFKFFKP